MFSRLNNDKFLVSSSSLFWTSSSFTTICLKFHVVEYNSQGWIVFHRKFMDWQLILISACSGVDGLPLQQLCCEAPTVLNGVRVSVWFYPNALGKRWGNCLCISTQKHPVYADNLRASPGSGKMGGRIFSQLLESGYEKFPHNTTALQQRDKYNA